MKGNKYDTTTARATPTTTRGFDYDSIEARARQLRRETLRTITDEWGRWLACKWAEMTRRPSSIPCGHAHTAAGNCANH
jgi:hypothetical protein